MLIAVIVLIAILYSMKSSINKNDEQHRQNIAADIKSDMEYDAAKAKRKQIEDWYK